MRVCYLRKKAQVICNDLLGVTVKGNGPGNKGHDFINILNKKIRKEKKEILNEKFNFYMEHLSISQIDKMKNDNVNSLNKKFTDKLNKLAEKRSPESGQSKKEIKLPKIDFEDFKNKINSLDSGDKHINDALNTFNKQHNFTSNPFKIIKSMKEEDVNKLKSNKLLCSLDIKEDKVVKRNIEETFVKPESGNNASDGESKTVNANNIVSSVKTGAVTTATGSQAGPKLTATGSQTNNDQLLNTLNKLNERLLNELNGN